MNTENITTQEMSPNHEDWTIDDHNVQHIANSLQGLIEKIESSNTTPSEKAEAKSLLQKVLSNPVVAAVLGGSASGLIELLK